MATRTARSQEPGRAESRRGRPLRAARSAGRPDKGGEGDGRRRKIQQQPLVRADEQPPGAVDERMRKALARVSRKRMAEPRNLEIQPDRDDRRKAREYGSGRPQRPIARDEQ